MGAGVAGSSRRGGLDACLAGGGRIAELRPSLRLCYPHLPFGGDYDLSLLARADLFGAGEHDFAAAIRATPIGQWIGKGRETMSMQEKVQASHLQRDAYLYVRQSTLQQVFKNTESTERQYALRRRAVALGWPVERIVVIDSDLGGQRQYHFPFDDN